MEIHYTTESPAKKYGKEIRNAKTLFDLLKVVKRYVRMADDAVRLVELMDENDFKQFHKDLPKLKNPKEKDVERLVIRWGDLVLPYKLMWSELVANKYHAPWGTAFLRCEESGWPKRKN